MTTATVQGKPALWNTPALANWLAENNQPGARDAATITRLRVDRSIRRRTTTDGPSLQERLTARLVRKARVEIRRRGGETEVLGKKDRVTGSLALADRDPAQRMTLVKAEGWRYYSSRTPQRYVTLAYLYGTDDSGPWAVRVPGTMETVAQALAWLTPNDVVKAMDKGLRVRRQGDVYAIETTKRRDGDGAPRPARRTRVAPR
ncbi:hypothetical protein ACFY91_24570 [Streptomyces albogriseolus]|uniref:hypothetical protein n=1 Tax=Streptomyces albogriseolus TaxID=1887 RepID=UPI0036E94BE7